MSKKKAKKKSKIKRTTAQDVEELLAGAPPKISMITGAKQKKEKKTPAAEIMSRHRIMSDEKIKFIWSKDSDVIHDKNCEHARKIGLKNLCASETYLPKKRQCPFCREMAYIRASGEYADRYMYLRFFKRANIDEDMMRRLLIDNDVETQIFNNVLTVKLNGDTWKIKALDDEKYSVELLCNNFEVRNGIRTVYEGFHRVKTGISIEEALDIMETYNWQEHSTALSLKRIVDKASAWSQRTKRNIRKRISVIKSFRNFVSKRAVYYVDGDNSPQERIIGIEKLTRRDRVKIFCASDGSYFHDPKRREELKEICDCRISFIPIKPGSNAVDFAIGMDAYYKCMSDPGCHIYLLSGDRHFTVIKQQIEAMAHKKTSVMHLNTIEQAYKKDEKYKFKGIWSCWKGSVEA